MSLLPATTDYTDKDFTSLRARLFALTRSVFPEWTDENAADFGNILVELFAHVGDVLGKYQDNQARESRWTTAQQCAGAPRQRRSEPVRTAPACGVRCATGRCP